MRKNDLQLLIVEATNSGLNGKKNQRDYYSGKAHAHTIKTEVVINPKGRILRVFKPYEGRIHDFEIRKFEGPLPAVSILSNSNYQGLQNDHSTAVILPIKKSINGSLSASEQARNTKFAAEILYILKPCVIFVIINLQKQNPKNFAMPHE